MKSGKQRVLTPAELHLLRTRGREVIAWTDRQRAAWRSMSRPTKRRWLRGSAVVVTRHATTPRPRTRSPRCTRRARSPSADDPSPLPRSDLDRQWARVWRAVLLAPSLDVCEALLAGERVPLDRLDPEWAERFGRRGR